jgi:hypothetical protein
MSLSWCFSFPMARTDGLPLIHPNAKNFPVGDVPAAADSPDEVVNPQIHQAWLLPESDIAIYEQRATEFNDAVVESMQVLR